MVLSNFDRSMLTTHHPKVVIHHNDADGYASALALKQYFVYANDNVTYYERNHGETVPEISNSDVFIVDFSYDIDILTTLCENNISVTVIDHHETFLQHIEGITDLPANLYLYVDIAHAGCILTYQYCFPNLEPSNFFKIIESIDLWKFNVYGSKEFAAYLNIVEYDLSVWQNLYATFDSNLKNYIELGKSLIKYDDNQIKILLKSKTYTKIGSYFVECCNCPPNLASKMGNILAKTNAFGVTYFIDGNIVRFSLRSIGELNVADIATQYGGGGHKNAAGFVASLNDFIAVTNAKS